jgi:hypothetical protein
MTEAILGTGIGASLATSVFATAAKTGWVYYGDELKGIAKASGVPLGKVVLLQIAYEAFAACTSIVANGPDGCPIHIRSMDWEMAELQPLTIEVDFVRGGVLVHRATTWAGYVGVLTGVRNEGFSVSVNYRRTELGAANGVGGIIKNLKRGVAGHWPVSFLIREVMESETTFDGAVNALQSSELMAPVYMTIAGTQPGQGLVLTRDREAVTALGECVSERLNGGDPQSFVIQTNMDIWRCDQNDEDDDWQDICSSRERRQFAKSALSSCSDPVSMNDLWLLLSVPPCRAHDTVYTTAMIPSSGELVTRVHVTHDQSVAARIRWRDVNASLISGSFNRDGATRQYRR